MACAFAGKVNATPAANPANSTTMPGASREHGSLRPGEVVMMMHPATGFEFQGKNCTASLLLRWPVRCEQFDDFLLWRSFDNGFCNRMAGFQVELKFS